MSIGSDISAELLDRTHPARVLNAAGVMWKRRGANMTGLKSNWVERLCILTDKALFWFDLGGPTLLARNEPIGSQQGKMDVRAIVSVQRLENGARAAGRATSPWRAHRHETPVWPHSLGADRSTCRAAIAVPPCVSLPWANCLVLVLHAPRPAALVLSGQAVLTHLHEASSHPRSFGPRGGVFRGPSPPARD